MIDKRITTREITRVTGLPNRIEAERIVEQYNIDPNKHKTTTSFLNTISSYSDNENKKSVLQYKIQPLINQLNNNTINSFTIKNDKKYRIHAKNGQKYIYSLSLDYIDLLDLFNKIRGENNSLFEMVVKQREYDNINEEFNKEKTKTFILKDGNINPVNHGKLIGYAKLDNNFRPEEFKRNFTAAESKLSADSSDYYNPPEVSEIVSVTFTKHKNIKTVKKKREGAFFKYALINNDQTRMISPMLEVLQIYLDDDKLVDKNNKATSCLINCLEQNKVEQRIIDKIKLSMKGNNIPICKLDPLFLAEKIRLVLYQPNQKIRTFGDKKSENIVRICLSDGHYFPYMDIQVTDFAIRNIDYEVYESLSNKQKQKWFSICKVKKTDNKKTYLFESKRCSVKSNKLVESLLENKDTWLTPIRFTSENIKLSDYDKLNDDAISLDNDSEMNDYKQILPKKQDTLDKHDIKVFYDFETVTEQEHKTFMVCYQIYLNNKKVEIKETCITGLNCEKTFLDTIKDHIYKIIFRTLDKDGVKYDKTKVNKLFNISFIAHNITYDFAFLMKYGSNMNICERGAGLVCGGYFYYAGLKINLKDTYALIPYKLSKFSEIFKIENIEKEVMPYKLYTEQSVQQPKTKISEALNHLKKEEHDKFLDNIKRLNLIKDDEFDHLAYSKFYCQLDVDIMCKGYFTFKEWIIKDLGGINIDNFLTISSIADSYFRMKGCYEDCYQLTGIARWFIQKCVVGGRCMISNNEKKKIIECLNDFDGVSLYPSAMERLGLIGGFLKGKPKHLKTANKNFEFLSQQDGYFIKVRFLIDDLPIQRDFPLLSSLDKDGIRVFSNKINEKYYYLDKISIEDLIEFHNINPKNIKIIAGYYFNEGRNNKILDNIRYVFDKRVEYKNQGNPIQELYKLVMNSCYGKNIMKERTSKNVYLDTKDKMLKYVSRNYNQIESEIINIPGSDKYIVSVFNPIHNHYNSCHIGCEILSMSKRIMNEVMCLAEDNKIKIYYQDTDSMHIQNDKIEILSKKFKNKYNRELIGKKLGQFHNDFEPIYINGKEVKASCSVESIFLGKKSYIDKVKYEYTENKEKIITYKYHIRMKSIPTNCINNHPDYKNEFDMYEDLLKGSEVSFDLLTCIPGFKNNKNGNIITLSKFDRSVSFGNKSNNSELTKDICMI